MEAYGSLWKPGGLVTQYTTPQQSLSLFLGENLREGFHAAM